METMRAELLKNPGWEAGRGRWDEVPLRYGAVKVGQVPVGWITVWPRYLEVAGERVAQLPYVSMKLCESRGGAMSRHIGGGAIQAVVKMAGYIFDVRIRKRRDGRRKCGYFFDVQIKMSDDEEAVWMATPAVDDLDSLLDQAERFFPDG
jgi:hypothetical protein